MWSTTRKTLADGRRSFLAWGCGLGAATALYTASYVVSDPDQYTEILNELPIAVVDGFGLNNLSTPGGYLGATVFALVIPAVLVAFATSQAVQALAGDEEAGTIELLLSQPISRRSLLGQRALGVVIAVLLATLLVFVVIAGVAALIEMRLDLSNVAAACLQLAALALFFGSIAVLLGAATGTRGPALGGTAALAIASYICDAVLSGLDVLRWTQFLSAFHYYDGPATVTGGFNLAGLSTLIGTAAISFALASHLFLRRDIAL